MHRDEYKQARHGDLQQIVWTNFKEKVINGILYGRINVIRDDYKS